MNSSDLITVASIIAGFGITVMMFRLQRELQISDENWTQRGEGSQAAGVPTWFPLADYLVIVAIVASLLGGVLSLLIHLAGFAYHQLRVPQQQFFWRVMCPILAHLALFTGCTKAAVRFSWRRFFLSS